MNRQPWRWIVTLLGIAIVFFGGYLIFSTYSEVMYWDRAWYSDAQVFSMLFGFRLILTGLIVDILAWVDFKGLFSKKPPSES